MEEKIDELKSQRIFDLSTTKGIRSFCTHLVGELHLMDGNFQRSSIKGWLSYNHSNHFDRCYRFQLLRRSEVIQVIGSDGGVLI